MPILYYRMSTCKAFTCRKEILPHLFPLHKQTPDLEDESGHNPGNYRRVEGSKTGPLPGLSLASNSPDSGNAWHIEQIEDHEGEGDQRCPTKLGSKRAETRRPSHYVLVIKD